MFRERCSNHLASFTFNSQEGIFSWGKALLILFDYEEWEIFIIDFEHVPHFPANIFLNNGNTRKKWIMFKVNDKNHQNDVIDIAFVFIVNFERVPYVLLFLLLT